MKHEGQATSMNIHNAACRRQLKSAQNAFTLIELLVVTGRRTSQKIAKLK